MGYISALTKYLLQSLLNCWRAPVELIGAVVLSFSKRWKSRRNYMTFDVVLSASSGGIGADFHRTMVATAPGEKLLIARRRPVRNWTRRTIPSLFLCIKLHLFLGKSTKTAATRAALFHSNMHQIVCRQGLCPRPHWGSLQRSPRPPSYIQEAFF